VASNRCLYPEARLLLGQTRLLSRFILATISVVRAHIDDNPNLFLSYVSAELLNKILSLLLKLGHLIEYPGYHVFIWAVSCSTHATRSLRKTMLLIWFLPGICNLMPSVSCLIDALQGLQASLACTLGQHIGPPIVGAQTYSWRHILCAKLQSF